MGGLKHEPGRQLSMNGVRLTISGALRAHAFPAEMRARAKTSALQAINSDAWGAGQGIGTDFVGTDETDEGRVVNI
jgi:hypothetical protein